MPQFWLPLHKLKSPSELKSPFHFSDAVLKVWVGHICDTRKEVALTLALDSAVLGRVHFSDCPLLDGKHSPQQTCVRHYKAVSIDTTDWTRISNTHKLEAYLLSLVNANIATITLTPLMRSNAICHAVEYCGSTGTSACLGVTSRKASQHTKFPVTQCSLPWRALRKHNARCPGCAGILASPLGQ